MAISGDFSVATDIRSQFDGFSARSRMCLYACQIACAIAAQSTPKQEMSQNRDTKCDTRGRLKSATQRVNTDGGGALSISSSVEVVLREGRRGIEMGDLHLEAGEGIVVKPLVDHTAFQCWAKGLQFQSSSSRLPQPMRIGNVKPL